MVNPEDDKKRASLVGLSYDQAMDLVAELFVALLQEPKRVGLVIERKNHEVQAIKVINPVWEDGYGQ